MVNRYLSLFFSLLTGLLLVSQYATANDLKASVDRNRLTQNETVTLSLRTPGLQLTGEPDLSELYQDFEILAQQVRTNIQIINGENQSERLWEISLLPKRSGTLIIPEISLGNLKSQPITLEVQPPPQNTNATADIFLHSEIDQEDSIYVQQQLIYTLRLYYATSISDHGLTDLELDNVLTVQLGNRKDFEAKIDGRLYNVAEWQFALYPQSSGELVIPPQTFSGRVRLQNRYSLGGLKHIRIQSPEHKITVKPVPDAFPQNAQWLPAKALTLSEKWSGNFAQWQEGTPLTRTLTLNAEGLTAAQLPPIVMSQQPLLRQYPEQPQLEDLPLNLNAADASITGTKNLNIALIPTQAGHLLLPKISIPWWNTQTDQLEYASLDSLSLSISLDPNRVPEPVLEPVTQEPNNTVQTPSADGHSVLLWQLLSFALVVISLLLALFWRQTRQQLHRVNLQLWHSTPKPTPGQTPSVTTQENPIFRQALMNACQQNQARAAWDAWQKWHQHEAPQTTPDFDQALSQLQYSLFGPVAQPELWDGRVMAKASKSIHLAKSEPEQALPKLYP